MRQRLAAEIQAACRRAEGLPMRWGTDDCALWCADIYRTVLGVDPAAAFRGRYDNERGALRLLGRDGLTVAALEGMAAANVPLVRVDPADAATGDLGMVETPDGPACVIKSGALWLGRIDGGFAAHPDGNVLCAWSVS